MHSNAQFLISLEYSTNVDGKQQLITLRYEGDNLVPDGMLLKNFEIKIPADFSFETFRQGRPEIRTLSLTLRPPCSVWYPKTSDKLSTSFSGLLTLAWAAEVCICFDVKWLGENTAGFEKILRSSQEFAKVPLTSQFTNLYQKLDWRPLLAIEPRALIPNEDLASRIVPSIEIAGADASPSQDLEQVNPPPPYTSKRPRHTDSSLTPDPNSKRARDYSRSPSEAELRAKSIAWSDVTEQVDLFQGAIASAVQQELAAFKKEFTQVVEELRVVKKELAAKEKLRVAKKELAAKELAHAFEEGFRRMLAGHSPSPPLSPTPPNTQISKAPPYHNQTPSRRFIDSTEIQKKIEEVARQLLAPVADEHIDQFSAQACETIAAAVAEIDESLTDSRLDLAKVSEDYKADFNEFCNEKADEFGQQITESKEAAEAHLNAATLEAADKFDTVIRQMLLKYGCLPSAHNEQNTLGTNRRALSAPLLREDEDGTVKE